MDHQINKALLKKYIAGADLSEEELVEVESILLENEALAEEIANELQETPLQETLKKGIQQTGEQEVKKKLNEVTQQLTNTGFFIDTNQIQQYLKGTLAGPMLSIFEQRLANDTAFAENVAKEQNLLSGIRQFGEQTVKDKLAHVQKGLEEKGFFEAQEQKEKTQAKVVSLWNPRNLAIAASILLLVGFFFWNNPSTTFDANQTFATHFTLPTDELSKELEETGFVREPYYDGLENAMSAYQQQDFPKAIELLETYQKAAPVSDDFYSRATFYLALAQLKSNNASAAIDLLNPLSEQSAAKWYLALAHLKNNEIEHHL